MSRRAEVKMLKVNSKSEAGISVEGSLLTQRPRRLRQSAGLRRMVRETTLSPDDFIYPLFVAEGHGLVRPISSMPGHAQRSVDMIAPEIEDAASLGIPAVLLFGLPAEKDEIGSGSWDEHGP